MKKYIFLLLLLSLIVVPLISRADISRYDQIQAMIADLQRQIAILQNQSTSDCPFIRDLSYGDGDNDSLRPDVLMLQKWLIGTYLNIAKPTGYFGSMTRSAIKRWQKDNFLTPTGKIGFAERLALCGANNNPTEIINIDSVSGPTSISVGQTGTWQVKVTAPTNMNLTYSVDWGDNLVYPTSANSAVLGNVNQTSTFTHTYNQSGTYTVKFRIDNGVVCITAPCNVRKTAETSMTVVVGGGVINNNGLTITYPADPANWHDYVGGTFSKVFTVSPNKGYRYAWSITSGSLPLGLNLNLISHVGGCTPDGVCPQPDFASTAVISGTPTQTGNFPFTLTVRDNLGNTGSLSLNINIEANNNMTVLLGQPFTLGKDQIIKIANTGLEVKITDFYNSPCVQCIWSGVGIGFEYHLNGLVQKGINLVQAFGYQTTVIKTDNKTYANLIVERIN